MTETWKNEADCNECDEPIDLNGLHIMVELETEVLFHTHCFLNSDWYDPKDITGKAIINANTSTN